VLKDYIRLVYNKDLQPTSRKGSHVTYVYKNIQHTCEIPQPPTATTAYEAQIVWLHVANLQRSNFQSNEEFLWTYREKFSEWYYYGQIRLQQWQDLCMDRSECTAETLHLRICQNESQTAQKREQIRRYFWNVTLVETSDCISNTLFLCTYTKKNFNDIICFWI